METLTPSASAPETANGAANGHAAHYMSVENAPLPLPEVPPAQTQFTPQQQHPALPPIPRSSEHRFEAGVKYRFGAIDDNDVKTGNYHNPTFQGKFPVHKAGEWFIINGYNTVGDFERHGVQDNGRPFIGGKTFVMQVMKDPDLTPTTIYMWEFEQRAKHKQNEATAANNGAFDRNDNQSGVSNRNVKRFRTEALGGLERVVDVISANQQQSLTAAQTDAANYRREVERLRTENIELRALNDSLKNTNATVSGENTRLVATFEERVKAIQQSFTEKEKALQEHYDFRLTSETKRIQLEGEVETARQVKAAVAAAEKIWSDEWEAEEESLADEIEEDKKQQLADEYRKIEREWEKLEKEKERYNEKKGITEKGAEFLGGLLEKPEGQAMVQAGFATLAGMFDKFSRSRFPDQYGAIEQQAQAAMQAQAEAQAAATPAEPPPPVAPDDWEETSTDPE
jgi:hypothetical protein